MFTIFVLPLLLYPFMGMLMLQVAQFNSEHPVTVAWIGEENWPSENPLVVESAANAKSNDLVRWNYIAATELANSQPIDSQKKDQHKDFGQSQAEALVRAGKTDLVLITKPGFREWLVESKKQEHSSVHPIVSDQEQDGPIKPEPMALATGDRATMSVPIAPEASGDGSGKSQFSSAEAKGPPPLLIVVNQASDASVVASKRVGTLLENWRLEWLREQLAEAKLNPSIVDVVSIHRIDIAPPETKQALVWSKILPLIMLVWALTGAFYPAIDLCAGEKERGTLETLLCSPASRTEIVWGKLLTVICFSISTAVLNLFSMQFTSTFVINQFASAGASDVAQALGPLPLSSLTWLIVILLPLSAMFSALALAVAALAKSSKEAQYYLMPLLLGGLPLVMLPMLPGVTLGAGTAAIPVTGAVLLSRALIEGHYGDALFFAPVVIAVTVICCLLAIRWAVRQFENESVLFRESERFEIRAWIQNLLQHRTQTATANEAILCGAVILVALFFGRMSLASSELTWASMQQSTIVIQIGMILAPCLIMATILTSSVWKSLRLGRPRLADLLFCFGLGLSLHPAYMLLSSAIQHEFQLGAETKEVLGYVDAMISEAPLWSVILTLAVIPAICEELAFRGFIFAGLSQQQGTLRAIILSALFFGLSHGVLQQTIGATIMGLILGVVAWRTGGVLGCIVLHMTHNALTMVVARAGKQADLIPSSFNWVFEQTLDGGIAYTNAWTIVSMIISSLILAALVFNKPETAGYFWAKGRTVSPES
jgi:sodium transport system permease protein